MSLDAIQSADLALSGNPFSIQAKVVVTPLGLLTIAALVSAILLSTAVLVQAAKK